MIYYSREHKYQIQIICSLQLVYLFICTVNFNHYTIHIKPLFYFKFKYEI